MDQTIGPANNSPMLLADPTDERFVVLANRLDAPDFGCALQISGDRGKSWRTVNPVPVLPPGAEKCYAPEVAFDGHGRLYYLFVGLQGIGNEPMGAFITTSVDHAQKVTSPLPVLGGGNFGVRMALDPGRGKNGRLYLTWLHATAQTPSGGFGPPPNPIMSAYSDDGGKSLSRPIQVSDPGRGRVVAPAMALAPDGTVYIAYYDLGEDARDYQGLEGPTWEGVWSLVLSSSVDGGRTFTPGLPVDTSVVPPERVMLIFTMPPPSLAATDKLVCMGWSDARYGDPDVFARCSSDRGRTWSLNHRLNDDPRGNGLRQFLPHLSFSPNGRLDAIFYDRRRNHQNIGNDVFYTFSLDAGKRFSPSKRITSDPSDSRIGQRYAVTSAQGQVEIGSRLALLSRGDDLLAAWADSRNSKSGTTGQDIFVASVTAPELKSDRAGLFGGFLVVVGLGAVISSLIVRRRKGHEPILPAGTGGDLGGGLSNSAGTADQPQTA